MGSSSIVSNVMSLERREFLVLLKGKSQRWPSWSFFFSRLYSKFRMDKSTILCHFLYFGSWIWYEILDTDLYICFFYVCFFLLASPLYTPFVLGWDLLWAFLLNSSYLSKGCHVVFLHIRVKMRLFS